VYESLQNTPETRTAEQKQKKKKKKKAGELGAGTHAPLAASPAFPSGSRLVKAAMPSRVNPEGAIWLTAALAAAARATKTREAVAPATPPRALLATPCPPSSGKRGPSLSRSSPSPGSSGGRPPPQIDAEGFQLVVGRTGKERSGGKVPNKKARARERERDGSL